MHQGAGIRIALPLSCAMAEGRPDQENFQIERLRWTKAYVEKIEMLQPLGLTSPILNNRLLRGDLRAREVGAAVVKLGGDCVHLGARAVAPLLTPSSRAVGPRSTPPGATATTALRGAGIGAAVGAVALPLLGVYVMNAVTGNAFGSDAPALYTLLAVKGAGVGGAVGGALGALIGACKH
jgi:hypothetical protein